MLKQKSPIIWISKSLLIQKAYIVLTLLIALMACNKKQFMEARSMIRPANDTSVYDTAPRWSPDGKKILFYTYRHDSLGAELYTITPNGTDLNRITSTYPNEWWSDYSPHGDLIYISSDRDKSERYGGSEIYALSSSGAYTRLTFSADTSSFNIYPRISSDGEQLLYCANCIGKDVNSDIYLISADGENPINLTNHTASDRYGSWSPDGKQILFESNRNGNFELYVLSLETKELRQLTFNESNDIQGDWSSNNEIVFSSNRDGDYEIYVMKSDGTNIRQLTFNKDKDFWPSWSPDGTHIAFSAYRRGKKNKADVYLIQSDGDSEKLLSL